MIFPEPAGWDAVAREIALRVAVDLGDLLSIIEPWIAHTGAPAPSERYDENALMATGALVVNAAKAGLALRNGDPTLGGPVETAEALESELATMLVRSLEGVPETCRRLVLAGGRLPARGVGLESPAIKATIERVARAAVQVLLE